MKKITIELNDEMFNIRYAGTGITRYEMLGLLQHAVALMSKDIMKADEKPKKKSK